MHRGIVVMAVVLAFAAACGDSDATDGEETPLPSSTPAVTLTGVHAEAAGLLEGAELLTFRLVLERTEPPEVAGDRLVITNSAEGTRIDTIPSGEDAPVTTLIELAGEDDVISCEDGPTAWRCFRVDSFGRSILRTAVPITFFPAFELDAYEVTEVEGRTIAGEEARCFRIEPPEEDIIEYCFNPGGVPVFSSPVFGTYEATEVSEEIPSDAFEPPVDVE